MKNKQGVAVLAASLLGTGQATAETTITLKDVTISGLIEVQAINTQYDERDATGDIIVADSELNISARMNELVTAVVGFQYKEGKVPLEMDISTITLSPDESNWFITGGRQYLPFGRYKTNLISDTLTFMLGEINESALIVGVENEGLVGSVYFFNGANNNSSNLGFDLSYTKEPYGFSLSYLDNLPETNLFGEGLGIDEKYAGVAASGYVTLEPITIIVEYLGASREIHPAIVSVNGKAATPETWNIEVGSRLTIMDQPAMVSLAYQGSNEAVELDLPKSRLMAGLGVELVKDTTLSFELSQDQNYGITDGGNDEKSQTFKAQLAVKF